MARVVDFIIPPMGESIEAARLVSWNVQPDQLFQSGDVLLEIETDKAVVEVPATFAGKLIQYLVQVDDVLDSDTPVARVEVDENDVAAITSVTPTTGQPENEVAPPTHNPEPAGHSMGDDEGESRSAKAGPAFTDRVMATPAARRAADERGLLISAITGSGPEGRIVKADVLKAAESSEPLPATHRSNPKSGGSGTFHDNVPTKHGSLHITQWRPDSPRGAPTAVLIHGVFGDADTWSSLGGALSRAGIEALAVDLPCHGQSRSSATSLADIVDAVAQAIVACVSGPIALVGHSFGAAVVARLAKKAGLDVTSVVLIAPVGLGTEIQQSFLDGMLHSSTDEALIRELRKLTVSEVTVSNSYLSEICSRTQQRGEALAVLCEGASRNGIQQISIIDDLDRISAPITVIQGRRDAIIPWRHVLNAPAKVSLHLFKDAGHMPQWDAASLVGSIVTRTIV